MFCFSWIVLLSSCCAAVVESFRPSSSEVWLERFSHPFQCGWLLAFKHPTPIHDNGASNRTLTSNSRIYEFEDRYWGTVYKYDIIKEERKCYFVVYHKRVKAKQTRTFNKKFIFRLITFFRWNYFELCHKKINTRC